MTISERTAGRLLTFTAWVLIVYAALGVLNGVLRLVTGGTFQFWMMVAIWLIYAGIRLWKRDDNWRKAILIYSWMTVAFLLLPSLLSLIKSGTIVFFKLGIIYQVGMVLILLCSSWTIWLLHHPAIRSCCRKSGGEQ